MSEQSSRPAVRFCPGCGEPAARGANFCVSCGTQLRAAGAPRVAAGASREASPVPLPGLVVLVAFLAVGLGIWFWVLQPQTATRMPLAKDSAAGSGEMTASGGALPGNHPPVVIPAEVKTYIADLERKAAAAPKDLEAWKNVAQVEYRAGQVDREYLSKAESSFRHVLEIDAKDLDALRGLGNVHFDREEYRDAVTDYARYLELKPNDPDVRTDLGTMYLYDGEDEKAIGEYRKVIAADPKFYQAHFNLGIAYAKRGETDKAIEAFGKAKSLAPDDKTREQIASMMERARGGASEAAAAEAPNRGEAAAGGPAPAGNTVQAIMEQNLRAHPIVGPKLVKFEWPTPTSGRVLLDNFPMQAMPDMVRQKFLDRVKSQLADAKQRTGATAPVRLDLVDAASGQVMATVTSD